MTTVPSRAERRAIRRQRKQGRSPKRSRSTEDRAPRRILDDVTRGPRFERVQPPAPPSPPRSQTKFPKGTRVHITTSKASFVEKHGTTGVFTGKVLEDGKYEWVSDRSGKKCKSTASNVSVFGDERFKVGDKVEARYKAEWFNATITCVNDDNTYALKWEEGFTAPRWKAMFIRRPAPSPTPSPMPSPQLRAVAAPFVPKPKKSSKKPRKQPRQFAFPAARSLNPNAPEFSAPPSPRRKPRGRDRQPRNSDLNPLAPTWKSPSDARKQSPDMTAIDRALDRAISPPLVRSTSA